MTRKKKAALGLLFFAGLVFLLFVGWHYQGRRELEKYKATLVAQGEFLSLTQAWPKPLKGDWQKAQEFLSAATQWKRGAVLHSNQVPAMRLLESGRALAGSLRPDIRGTWTNTWQDLEMELEENQEVLERVRKCLDGSTLDFNLAYHSGFSMTLPYYSSLRPTAQILWMASAFALHNRNLDAAQTNLVALLNLSQVFQEDRATASELLRIRMANISASATWEALQTAGWSDAQLKALQNRWLSLKFLEPMGDSLVMRRAMTCETITDLRGSTHKLAAEMTPMSIGSAPGTESFIDSLKDLFETTKIKAACTLWHYFWSYPDEKKTIRIYQVNLDALQFKELSWKAFNSGVSNRLRAEQLTQEDGKLLRVFGQEFSSLKTFFSNNALNTHPIQKAFAAETLKEIVAAAIALKRYQIRHGKYPSNLSQLVPEFLPKVPVDYMDAEPLRYSLNTDGTFTLYSVGGDLKDDKGAALAPTMYEHWMGGGDWVWPLLATPGEIEQYETERAARYRTPRRRRSGHNPPAFINTNTITQ